VTGDGIAFPLATTQMLREKAKVLEAPVSWEAVEVLRKWILWRNL